MEKNKKTFLFWVLVIGIFLVIFLLWIPQLLGNVTILTTTLKAQSTSQTSSFQNEWTARTEEIKKNFDTLLKQTETLTNTESPKELFPQNLPSPQ
mgnify:CR=1 FL=1